MRHLHSEDSQVRTRPYRDLPLLRDYSDEELVSLYYEGRPEAFRELYNRYQTRLSRFILRRTGNPERADDVLQEAWMRVARHLDWFDTERRFSTWIYTIVANLCKNELRNHARSPMVPFRTLEGRQETESRHLEFGDHSMTPDRLFQKRETRRLVERTVEGLSENHQRVFRLREMKGKSYQEVADILGIQLGTVKSRLHRARAEFAERIRPFVREEYEEVWPTAGHRENGDPGQRRPGLGS
jgi:RNA polymerase sigma-70 factor, ECF subfamily